MADAGAGARGLPGDDVLHDALGHAVAEVFSTMVGKFESLAVDAEAVVAALPVRGLAHVHFDREAVVEFRGVLEGHVTLRCNADGALDIARGLLMLDEGDSSLSIEEINDALKECANMVTGHVKTRVLDPLGGCQLSVPFVNSVATSAAAARDRMLLYRLQQGVISVEIWRREATATAA